MNPRTAEAHPDTEKKDEKRFPTVRTEYRCTQAEL